MGGNSIRKELTEYFDFDVDIRQGRSLQGIFSIDQVSFLYRVA